MKHLLLTTIAAVLVVGCATTQSPEPPTGNAPDISIVDAAKEGNIEAVKQHLAASADVKRRLRVDGILCMRRLVLVARKLPNYLSKKVRRSMRRVSIWGLFALCGW